MYNNFLAFLAWTLLTAFTSTTGYTEEIHFLDKYIIKVKSTKKGVKIIKKDANGNKICSIGSWDRKIKCLPDAKASVLECVLDSIEQDAIYGHETKDAISA